MKTNLMLIAVAVFGVFTNAAWAQKNYSYYPGDLTGGANVAGGVGNNNYHHASTLEEGVLRGAAELARGNGEYEYNSSRAMINAEEARRLSLENKKLKVETFWEIRRLAADAKAREQSPPATPEQLARWAKTAAPKRLASHELNVVAGEVIWPVALQGEAFEEQRAIVDHLAKQGGLSVKNQKVIREAVAQMNETLVSQLRSQSVRQMDFIPAKNFLRSLDFETNFEGQSAGLAAN